MNDTGASRMDTEIVPAEPASPPKGSSAMDFTAPIKAEPSATDKNITQPVPESAPYLEHELEPVPPPKHCTEGSLDLRIRDSHGDPIANLGFRILVKKEVVFRGSTDAKGGIPTIDGLKIGSNFEIQIKKDVGGYKLAAIGTIESEENYACLQSPKTRFEFATYSHPGSPGQADARKQQTIQSHNQKPADKPKISGNPDKKPEVKDDRDDKGNPKSSVIDGLRDWYNRNADNAAPPTTETSDLEYVKKLIEFGEKQAKWKYEKATTSDEYIQQMAKGTFKEPTAKSSEGYKNGISSCTKYVKVALWYAGYNKPIKAGELPRSIGYGVSPARSMGPALEDSGFRNITNQLPDARWAAPGDVIVYKRTAAPNNAGHIDIRTYDGYLSDFLGLYLPIRQFTVTGIYRKYSDLLPEKRVRAFLKVLREWECHEEKDDSQRYYMLQQPINGSRRFANTSKHPFEGSGINKGTFAGAYQMSLPTRTEGCDSFNLPRDFTPLTQDRLAVWRLEYRGALGFVRLGHIEKAVNALLKEWSSLPGGKDARKGKAGDAAYVYAMGDLLKVYEKNLLEL